MYIHFPLAWGLVSNSKGVHSVRVWCCHHGTVSGAVNTIVSSYVSALPVILSSCMPKAAVTSDIRGIRIIILEYLDRRMNWSIIYFQSWHSYSTEKLLKMW